MSLEEHQEIHEPMLDTSTMGLSRVKQMRNKFHSPTEQEGGLYVHYSPASRGTKEGVAKIMELLKLPNLHSITTKLNSRGGIDIVKLDFKSTLETKENTSYQTSSRSSTKFKYRNI